MSPGTQLRRILAKRELVVVPDCYNAVTARLIEAEGFPVAYCGGAAMGAMNFALPDYGLISSSEMIDLVRVIAQAISIPLIVDADQAGETTLNIRRAVQGFEAAGVAGIHIEDTTNPKHIPDSAGKLRTVLLPLEEATSRVEAAVTGRRDSDFVIIARTDELFNDGSVNEVIRRGRAFANAGADFFMPVFMPLGEIDRIAAEVPIPLVDVWQPVSDASDTRLRVNLMIGSHHAAVATHRQFVRDVRDIGLRTEPSNKIPADEWRRLLDGPTWDDAVRGPACFADGTE